ncbi:MAG: DUF58 domain-containing protein [Planctomycetes bacterium]|nr:DUF58 domain-containing protein [Planctomycetota bacterium]
MRIRPTELGLKGLMLLAALEIAFLATSYSNLFFLLIVFCGVLGGVGLLTGMRNVTAVRVLAVDVPAGPAGQPRAVRLSLDARRRTFDLVFALDDGTRDLLLPAIATAAGRQTLPALLPDLARGVRDVRALRITSRFPFGLFELGVRRPLAIEVVTYPPPSLATAATSRRSQTHGRHHDGTQPATVAGLRPFRTGDAVRDVHWKATARRGVPIVKEREAEAGDARTVVVDRRASADELERDLAAATAAVLSAAAAGPGVRLVSQGYTAHLPAGQPPPAAVLRWLAAATGLPADAAAPELSRRPDQEPARA